jgi:hypothetical protein
MITFLATLFASAAIGAQDVAPPDRFVNRIENGQAVMTDTFIGVQAVARDGEVWYAGLDTVTFDLVTGP